MESLAGRRILVVEDEYILAQCLCEVLEQEGVEVLGPVASIEDALALLERGPQPDAAVLDVNLGNQSVYPVADRLGRQQVPMLFTSGYDREMASARYPRSAQCTKPFGAAEVRGMLLSLLEHHAHVD